MNSPEMFLSWSHWDNRSVDAIIQRLSAMGHRVWHDSTLAWGENWSHMIGTRIRESDLFVILLSPSYLSSRWAEMDSAFILSEHRDRGVAVIPVMLRAVDDLGIFQRFEIIDAQNRSPMWIADRIAETIQTYQATHPAPMAQPA